MACGDEPIRARTATTGARARHRRSRPWHARCMATLMRPRNGKIIAGVCAALANRFGISAFLVRLIFVLSIVLPGPQVLLYLILWIVFPKQR